MLCFFTEGNQSRIFIGRTDDEAETPILWPPDAKNWLIGKDSDAGKDLRQEEKVTTEDEMVGCHWHNEHEFESTRSWRWTGKPGVLQSMGSQRVGHDWINELNWTEASLQQDNFFLFFKTTFYKIILTIFQE